MIKESEVAILKSSYTTYQKLEDAVKPYLSSIDSDSVVTIKINLCDAYSPDTGVITHPLFLGAILKILRKNLNKIKIKVVESDASVAQPDLFIKWFGFAEILKKWNAEYVNLSKDEVVYKRSNSKKLGKIPVPQTLVNSDFFITLPKLKTSSITKITCCLKNQFGCLPMVNKSKYHPVIDDMIAEINSIIQPNLSIVDGIISHIGVQGPSFGQPLITNLVLIGEDPVATDTVASKILGFNPKHIKHIVKSQKLKVGSMKYHLKDNIKISPIYRPNALEWLIYKIGSKMSNAQASV
jgi:uncharacterized protein (DUF362 family)